MRVKLLSSSLAALGVAALAPLAQAASGPASGPASAPASGAAASVTEAPVPAFYRWTDALPEKPGVILRREALEAAWLPQNAQRAFRILYTSTDGIGGTERVPVSGYVMIPAGTPPKGGWPVVIWAHGTTGVADVCAPSYRGLGKRDLAYMNGWLGRGFLVVATDYQGLGTAGAHPYLLYRPEAYSLLDSARAVLSDATFGATRWCSSASRRGRGRVSPRHGCIRNTRPISR